MVFTRTTLILAGLFAVAGCGVEEQMKLSLYGEGTGQGLIRITNDEDQAILGELAAGSSAEGLLAARSEVAIVAKASPGSHFVGFGGDCSGDKSPFTFELKIPTACSVTFDKD